MSGEYSFREIYQIMLVQLYFPAYLMKLAIDGSWTRNGEGTHDGFAPIRNGNGRMHPASAVDPVVADNVYSSVGGNDNGHLSIFLVSHQTAASQQQAHKLVSQLLPERVLSEPETSLVEL
jgi:hypothetical protein